MSDNKTPSVSSPDDVSNITMAGHEYKFSVVNMETSTSSSITLPTLTPALQPKVALGLTSTFISLYTALFLIVYIQLWMIWFFRHKRLSYQTVFLFLALLWSGLRVTLFSFYFNSVSRVNLFPLGLYWLLFCFPVCLQFIILCLLVLYFAQVVFKARAKYEPSRLNKPLKIGLFLVVVLFLSTNISCASISKKYEQKSTALPVYLLYIRVAINDSLFILMSVILSVCIYRMAKMSSASVVLEAKGTTVCQALAVCILIVFMYLSRAIYNIIAVCRISQSTHKLPNFGFGWINVTDQVDFVHLDEGYAYLSFAIVLFVWELLPMSIVIYLFRVRRPGDAKSKALITSYSQSTRAYFFDNPRRYDSNEDLNRSESHPGYAGNRDLNRSVVDKSDIYPSYLANPANYSTNTNRRLLETDSPYSTPTRPFRLGYGAVTTRDRSYSYSVSPVIHSLMQSGSCPAQPGSYQNPMLPGSYKNFAQPGSYQNPAKNVGNRTPAPVD